LKTTANPTRQGTERTKSAKNYGERKVRLRQKKRKRRVSTRVSIEEKETRKTCPTSSSRKTHRTKLLGIGDNKTPKEDELKSPGNRRTSSDGRRAGKSKASRSIHEKKEAASYTLEFY